MTISDLRMGWDPETANTRQQGVSHASTSAPVDHSLQASGVSVDSSVVWYSGLEVSLTTCQSENDTY